MEGNGADPSAVTAVITLCVHVHIIDLGLAAGPSLCWEEWPRWGYTHSLTSLNPSFSEYNPSLLA